MFAYYSQANQVALVVHKISRSVLVLPGRQARSGVAQNPLSSAQDSTITPVNIKNKNQE
jgi:hypothetical protein